MSDAERTVIAQANVTMDGMTAGPGGDLSFLMPHDPHAPARDRELATWLHTVEKVIFLAHPRRGDVARRARRARDVGAEMRALKHARGRDILVLNSPASSRRCWPPTSSTNCA